MFALSKSNGAVLTNMLFLVLGGCAEKLEKHRAFKPFEI